MSEYGITPGPWSLESITTKAARNKRAVTGKTRRICDISLDDDEQEANAHAIAEVPAMIEALEGLLREFVDSTVPLDAQFSSAIVIKEVEHARAILARIRGAA